MSSRNRILSLAALVGLFVTCWQLALTSMVCFVILSVLHLIGLKFKSKIEMIKSKEALHTLARESFHNFAKNVELFSN